MTCSKLTSTYEVRICMFIHGIKGINWSQTHYCVIWYMYPTK
jgi:hypothetical protein